MKKLIVFVIFVISSFTYLKAQLSNNEVKFGGRIMYDISLWETIIDDEVTQMTGVEFRRVRFFNSGKLFGNTNYKLQLDYSGGVISYKDVWIELEGLPFDGSLRVGHFKEPFRLEALTSSKYITFMERALPNAFSPERNTGVMYQLNLKDKISIQAGLFRESDIYGNDINSTSNVNATARVTYLVINDDHKLLHLGAAVSKRQNSDNTYGFSVRPENHLGTKLLTVSFENVDETNISGFEIAYISGPLSLQGEYILTTVSSESWGSSFMDLNIEHELSGYYAQLSYFLTGESRAYKSSYAGFNRVKPINNYGSNGNGAIELVARLSKMDLSKSNMGTLDDTTIGINWYLNPNTRVMLNYVLADLRAGDGSGDVMTTENTIQCRVQIDF
jgi:phosphate-selective porin OprO/OprP|tara:strand:- start:2669 stop:3832 length:1164 start_codon:yes stop_codon:yes gene_type:complete